MQVKVFEIRDRMTCIVAMAVRLEAEGAEDMRLLRRAGFAMSQLLGHTEPYILLTRLSDTEAQYDPYSWRGGARTLPQAHQYIINNWDALDNAQVIDVEYILGESAKPKASEVNR